VWNLRRIILILEAQNSVWFYIQLQNMAEELWEKCLQQNRRLQNVYMVENFARTIHMDQLYKIFDQEHHEEWEDFTEKVEEMALQARVAIRNEKICSNATKKINRLQKKRWKVKQKHDLTIKVKCWNAKGIFDLSTLFELP